ncbi:MAG: hypothetical protein ACRD1T_12780 [Acidimicrobiia bacterium]
MNPGRFTCGLWPPAARRSRRRSLAWSGTWVASSRRLPQISSPDLAWVLTRPGPAGGRGGQPGSAQIRGRVLHALRFIAGGGVLGEHTRHRLNRGGDRQANAALHRIVMARLRWDQRS